MVVGGGGGLKVILVFHFGSNPALGLWLRLGPSGTIIIILYFNYKILFNKTQKIIIK